MNKIPTMFKRDPDDMSSVLDEPHPDCQWVFDGEGVATRKYDGTCVKIEKGVYLKRREVKKGKNAPDDFIEVETDTITGKRVGWVPVNPDDKADKWHIEAYTIEFPIRLHSELQDGTYELIGPKIQGNPEKWGYHKLIAHNCAAEYPMGLPTFSGLCEMLKKHDIEGLVFHHPDGRMAKIKKKDFGIKR